MTLLATHDYTIAPPQNAAVFAPHVNAPAVVAPYAKDEEIYAEEDPTRYVYKVLSGAVRITRILDDGRRHVSAFHLPGEVFGYEPDALHAFSAEAIVDSRIAVVRRAAIDDLVDRSPEAGRAMWSLAVQDMRRMREHMLLLGRKSAAQRVASLLLELSERTGARDTVQAPMSRSDMADYLGLTIETVSRTLSQFERDGLIALPTTRRIVLKNLAALKAMDR